MGTGDKLQKTHIISPWAWEHYSVQETNNWTFRGNDLKIHGTGRSEKAFLILVFTCKSLAGKDPFSVPVLKHSQLCFEDSCKFMEDPPRLHKEWHYEYTVWIKTSAKADHLISLGVVWWPLNIQRLCPLFSALNSCEHFHQCYVSYNNIHSIKSHYVR